MVTKDQDFRDGHLLARSPRQLLVVATGNITNDALLALFERHLGAIVAAFDEATSSSCLTTLWPLAGARKRPTADAAQARNRTVGTRSQSHGTAPRVNCALKVLRVANRADSGRNRPESPVRK